VGDVIAAGNGKNLDNRGLKSPWEKRVDLILFSSYAGTNVKTNGDVSIILSEIDILAILAW